MSCLDSKEGEYNWLRVAVVLINCTQYRIIIIVIIRRWIDEVAAIIPLLFQ
jgi:hypothetical protein